MNLKIVAQTIRRFILRRVIPEQVWPKFVNIDGVSIKLRGTPYSFGTKMILKRGSYEDAERKILNNILYEGAQVIEMGGSIGVLTSIISSKIGKTGKIISIEASEKLSSYSRTWLEKSGNVKVVTGFGFPVFQLPASFKINGFDETAGSLGGRVQFSDNGGSHNAVINDNVYDLNKICNLFALEPEILVIDIEGSETILKHVKPAFPASVKYILIELHSGLYAHGESDKMEIIKALLESNFAITETESETFLFARSI